MSACVKGCAYRIFNRKHRAPDECMRLAPPDYEWRMQDAEANETRLRQELMRRWPDGAPPCAGCGGPHRFDTSIPSPLWNRVVRAAGLPDYLCTSCILVAFVKADESFTAELYGEPVNRPDDVPVIAVQVGARALSDTYEAMRATLRAHEETIGRLREKIETIVPYVLATIGPGCTARRSGEWIEVHEGRMQSSAHQLEALLTFARDALAAAPPGEYEHRVRRGALEPTRHALVEEIMPMLPLRIERPQWGPDDLWKAILDARAAIRALASKEP